MDFVAIDFETANHNRSSACSIGLAVVKDDTIVERRSFYIRPIPNYYAAINKRVHGITERDTDSAPTFLELWETELKSYLEGKDLVAHNAPFEKSVLTALSQAYNIVIPTDRIYCSLCISRCYLDLLNYRLDNVCSELGITFCNHHNAMADAIGCAEIILKIAQRTNKRTLEGLYENVRINHSNDSHNRVEGSLFESRKLCEAYRTNEAVYGKTFCFTGTLSYIQRDIAKVVIENAGGFYKPGISSKVDYLVVGDLSIFGENYQSGKLKKVQEYKEKGKKIEILTEEQFQEFVVYEGPHITKEQIEADSADFLKTNRANILYGKGVCLSEGLDNNLITQLSLLGIQHGPTHYEDEAVLTDFYIMSNSVIRDLLEHSIKSPTILRMESAMRKQLDPEETDSQYHRIKCISEDTIIEFIRRRKIYEKEVKDGVENKSMTLY